MNCLSRLRTAHQEHWQQPKVKEATGAAIILTLIAVGCLVPAGLAFAGKINMYSYSLITRSWNTLASPIVLTIAGSITAILAVATVTKLLAGLKSHYKSQEAL
ncbi:MAG: hypothetical protein JSS62_00900 [Verrucomicrobia bacterium]|nr:hypothetical protein [Verrucomicrobiota bacterium]MBS0645245.1 hypothetical protein [Verrucomicrobiota bacterium]